MLTQADINVIMLAMGEVKMSVGAPIAEKLAAMYMALEPKPDAAPAVPAEAPAVPVRVRMTHRRKSK